IGWRSGAGAAPPGEYALSPAGELRVEVEDPGPGQTAEPGVDRLDPGPGAVPIAARDRRRGVGQRRSDLALDARVAAGELRRIDRRRRLQVVQRAVQRDRVTRLVPHPGHGPGLEVAHAGVAHRAPADLVL